MGNKGWILAVVASCMFVAAEGSASLITDTIGGSFTTDGGSNIFTSDTAVVDGFGVDEFEADTTLLPLEVNGEPIFNEFSVDFGESGTDLFLTFSIVLELSGATFDFSDHFSSATVEFTDLDWVGDPGNIVGVFDIENSIGVTHTFTSDSITFDFSNAYIDSSADLAFFIDAAHGGPTTPTPVPEPATALLLCAGLAGFALRRRFTA